MADALRALPGVPEAEASVTGLVRVEFDRATTSEQAIVETMRRLGVERVAAPAVSTRLVEGARAEGDHAADEHARHTHGPGEEEHAEGGGHDHSHANILGPNTELIFAAASGVMLAVGYAIEKVSSGALDWLPFTFFLAAYFFGGFFTLREAIDNLRLRRFEIDSLMLVAAGGAAALGASAEGALLLFLFSLGHALGSHDSVLPGRRWPTPARTFESRCNLRW